MAPSSAPHRGCMTLPTTPPRLDRVPVLARWFGSPARVMRSARRARARSAVPLYPWLLADDFTRLPAAVQRLHASGPAVTARGIATVTPADTIVGRLLARLARLPVAGSGLTLRIEVTARGGGEDWVRHYPSAVFRTRQIAAGAAGSGLLCEPIGPIALIFRLEARSHGLTFLLREARLFGMRLPLPLRPIVQARETADDGTYRFFVRVDLPFIGRLIQYQGCLTEIENG